MLADLPQREVEGDSWIFFQWTVITGCYHYHSPCSGDHRPVRLVSAPKKLDILLFDPTEQMFKLRAGTELGIWAIVSANTGPWQQGEERKGEKGK